MADRTIAVPAGGVHKTPAPTPETSPPTPPQATTAPATGTPAWLAARRAERHQALLDESARTRAAVMVRPIDPEMVATIAAGRPVRPPDNRIPFLSSVARVTGDWPKADNPKIWERDIRPDRRPWDMSGFLRTVGYRARVRVLGKVKAPTLERVAQVIAHDFTVHGGGPARKTWKAIATSVGVCVRTVGKAVRWLERQGFLDTANAMVRRGGFTRRVANLYRPRTESIGRPAAETTDDGKAARIARMAAAFGLVARPVGMNTTAIRARAHPPPD